MVANSKYVMHATIQQPPPMHAITPSLHVTIEHKRDIDDQNNV